MNYPGNETLAEEIRERILNTFRQTLALAEKGDLREAQLGCDFVLRLDPMFEPARTLKERLETGGEPVPVADLKEIAGEAPAVDSGAAPAEGTDPGALEELDPVLPPRAAQEANGTPPSALESALDLSSLEDVPAVSAPAAADAGSDAVTAASGPQPAAADNEPIAELDNESGRRVDILLAEGQGAFDKAEYQSAIDAWSRIFLIDIDHPEANRRIDLARKLRAEIDRKLDETFHDAVSKVETGRLDEARAGFKAVLEMMPGHLAAQEYMSRLDAPDFAPPGPEPVAEGMAEAEALPGEPLESEGEYSAVTGPLLDEITKAGESVAARPRPAIGGVGRASKPPRSPHQTFRIVGVAALALLAFGGWFLYKNWNTFFPNALDAAAPVQLDPITRAKRTYAEAGAAIAVAQLRRLSPGHPQYAEAQALVAQWEASLDAHKPDSSAPEPEALAARDRLVEEGRTAFAQKEYLLVEELLERAASEAPLENEDRELLEQTKDNLRPLQAEIAMFREGEWEMALRNLWRMKESGSNSPDVQRLMVDSYFNLGVRDLQRQDATTARTYFQEATDLSGEDAEIARLMEFAEVYQSRPEDLLYRIFVKYLPFR